MVLCAYDQRVTTPRVRFAPAPTGFLHVGSARTALFNWLYARHHGGQMVLRIEDTDAALKTQQYVDAIIEPLRWLGLDWDEGPHFQSDRSQMHQAALQQLLDCGAAYFCDLTRDDIEQRCKQAGLPVGYHGWSRDRNVADGPGVVVRFRCPDLGETVVNDVVRGRVSFPNESLEDFVIRRGDGSITFHLANAVDDHDMAISHVIRGEDLLNTTPRVLLIREALGYSSPPVYAHLPLLVDDKRRKLSKRRHDVSLDDYRRRGYLPEAMVNYLTLLGWGPPDEIEIRPIDEIIKLFDLDAVKPAPAFFDPVRLDHINSSYIKSLTPQQFAASVDPFITSSDIASSGITRDSSVAASSSPSSISSRSVVELLAGDIQQRIARLDEVQGWIDWILSDEISYDDKAWQKSIVKGRAAAEVLEAVEERLADDDFTSAERLEAIVMSVGDELSERLGMRVRSQAPVRLAVSGRAAGLPLWMPLRLLGKDETLSRLRKARSRLASSRP